MMIEDFSYEEAPKSYPQPELVDTLTTAYEALSAGIQRNFYAAQDGTEPLLQKIAVPTATVNSRVQEYDVSFALGNEGETPDYVTDYFRTRYTTYAKLLATAVVEQDFSFLVGITRELQESDLAQDLLSRLVQRPLPGLPKGVDPNRLSLLHGPRQHNQNLQAFKRAVWVSSHKEARRRGHFASSLFGKYAVRSFFAQPLKQVAKQPGVVEQLIGKERDGKNLLLED